jgi:excinuclease UvrABC ATPase subunit
LDECEDCGGKRLRKEALSVYLETTPFRKGENFPLSERGNLRNIVEITDLSIEEAKIFFDTIHLTEKEKVGTASDGTWNFAKV